MGIKYTVTILTLSNGNISYICLKKLMREVIPRHCIEGWDVRPHTLEIERRAEAISQDDLSFFVVMNGTDHLRKGLPGSGVVDCTNRMKEYLMLSTLEEKQQYINTYAENHTDTEGFKHASYVWNHALSYIIVPNDTQMSPKDAFFAGNYSVMLGSMTAVTDNTYDRYEPVDDKLGFLPHTQLREGHPPTEEWEDPPAFIDLFQLSYWGRTGKSFDTIPNQKNGQGIVVFPGAIIDFDIISIKHQPTRALKLWLSTRGVPATDVNDRSDLSQETCEDAAKPNTNDGYIERFNIRARNTSRSLHQGLSGPTMYSYYCKHAVENELKDEVNGLRSIEECMTYPDDIVYPPGVEEEGL